MAVRSLFLQADGILNVTLLLVCGSLAEAGLGDCNIEV